MGPEVVNKNGKSNFYGDYVGRDNITVNVTLFQESEREFVVTHNANIMPASYFTGRETELQELSQRIEEGRKSVLVSGMGGIGKTHICRKLFEKYVDKRENGSFQHIGYIEYDREIDSSLQRCLKFKKQSDPEKNKEAVWQELEYLASSGKLLLFVDNVNVSIGEDPHLKRLMSIPGAIILTSRRRVFSKEFESYRIGFLSIEQCKEVYEKIRYENSDTGITEEEAPDLEYIIETLVARHTITIEFLAHLAWTNNWTVKRLRDELERNGFRLEYMDEEDKLVNIQKSYEVLYDMSMLTEAEQNILEAFSVFPYIPLKVEICNQWLLADAGVDEEDYVLMKLYQKGWLQFDMELESYAMHPVFAQFIYDKCKPSMDNHMRLIESCKKELVIPKSGLALECQQYIPFAENLLEKMPIENCTSKAEFIEILAHLLQHIAIYDKAEKLSKKCLDIRRKALGENHLDTARSYNNLAFVYVKKGEYKNAEKLCVKSLQIRKKVLDENDPDIAIGYNNLAVLYSIQGEYKNAEEMQKKSLKIKENIFREDHPDIARSLSNLAEVYVKQGKYSKAEELYKRSLQIKEKILGENHLDTAISYNNLAKMHDIQGKYKEAERLYEKSLQIRQKVLGENHPDTASAYSNLVGVYVNQGKYRTAEELCKKSLQIRESMLGLDHPDTADSYRNLAEVYAIMGEYETAERLHEKSLLIRRKALGEDHPDTALSYNNLAGVYNSKGEYVKAKILYEKSLHINKKMVGENHPDTALAYCNLASVYEKLEENETAIILYEKSLQIRKKIFGEYHSDTAISYNNLAGVYSKRGDYVKAEEFYKKGLQIWESVLGENHTNTATGYNNLACIYESQGNYEKAKELYEKSLRIREKVLGEEHPSTAASYNNLAGLYESQGEYEIALTYYLRAYKIFVSKLGLNHPNTKIVYVSMGLTYSEWDANGDFELWLKEKMEESD